MAQDGYVNILFIFRDEKEMLPASVDPFICCIVNGTIPSQRETGAKNTSAGQ